MKSILVYLIFIQLLLPSLLFAEKKSVDDILEILASEHPESKSLAGTSQAHKFHTEASGILPDPKVGFAFRNYPTRNGYSLSGNKALDTPTMTGMELSVSQEFPFPGKLDTQKKVSKFLQSEADLAYLSGVNRIAGELFLRLNRFKSFERKKLINQRVLSLLDAQKSISESSYSYGGSTLAGVLKTTVAKTEAVARETEYSTSLNDLRSQLDYYLISGKLSFADLSEMDLDSFLEKEYLELESLMKSDSSIVETSPDYKIQTEEERRLKEQAKLARYSLAPETEVFFSYMKRKPQTFVLDQGPLNYALMDVTEYRGDLFSLGINMRVPVWSALKWDSITGESDHLAEAGKDSVEKTRNQMFSELQRNLSLFKGLAEQIGIFEKRLIPELEKAARAGTYQYAAGKSNVLDTLLVQTEILNTKIRLEDLKERKNESIISVLKLLSLLYKEIKTSEHKNH
ncbi:TolC family protein [Leptospira idonii]|uniref:Transporter n=1 Tax=Leptospira idonii TaxID=1193500 RepID=A0A4R9LX53_9LEPT|nr:TolC family protein [Leptospira idonii]TGN18840.1 transporter [Leptospira idonii]